MITIAIRERELVSSNVDTLVSKAGDQRKMLRLLQSEIEDGRAHRRRHSACSDTSGKARRQAAH